MFSARKFTIAHFVDNQISIMAQAKFKCMVLFCWHISRTDFLKEDFEYLVYFLNKLFMNEKKNCFLEFET